MIGFFYPSRAVASRAAGPENLLAICCLQTPYCRGHQGQAANEQKQRSGQYNFFHLMHFLLRGVLRLDTFQFPLKLKHNHTLLASREISGRVIAPYDQPKDDGLLKN